MVNEEKEILVYSEVLGYYYYFENNKKDLKDLKAARRRALGGLGTFLAQFIISLPALASTSGSTFGREKIKQRVQERVQEAVREYDPVQIFDYRNNGVNFKHLRPRAVFIDRVKYNIDFFLYQNAQLTYQKQVIEKMVQEAAFQQKIKNAINGWYRLQSSRIDTLKPNGIQGNSFPIAPIPNTDQIFWLGISYGLSFSAALFFSYWVIDHLNTKEKREKAREKGHRLLNKQKNHLVFICQGLRGGNKLDVLKEVLDKLSRKEKNPIREWLIKGSGVSFIFFVYQKRKELRKLLLLLLGKEREKVIIQKTLKKRTWIEYTARPYLLIVCVGGIIYYVLLSPRFKGHTDAYWIFAKSALENSQQNFKIMHDSWRIGNKDSCQTTLPQKNNGNGPGGHGVKIVRLASDSNHIEIKLSPIDNNWV
jgi:hypothetical protein